MDAPPVITLLTDFGDRETFAGQMRGIISGICPAATVIDLTHQIPPQDVLCGAIQWADALEAFPPGAVHVGVVDPGVGSARRAIAAEIGPWRFVAPDNGLLTAVSRLWPLHAAVELDREEWHRQPRSATFHGRDLFAPVAAHWAGGVSLRDLGNSLVDPLVDLELPVVTPLPSGIRAEILWADRFGNLMTSITTADVPANVRAEHIRVTFGSQTVVGLSTFYAERVAGSILALWGSSGRLEIAVSQGAACELPGTGRGTPVFLEWPKSND